MSLPPNAEGRLINYFSDGGWEIYDGVEVAHDSPLTVCDIVLPTSLNARLTRMVVWQVWKKRQAIEQALSRISLQLSLDDDNIPWELLLSLFNEICEIKGAKEAVITKILHKKRHALIPIYDK